MSKRESKLYLDDILDASKAIKSFIGTMTFEEFANDRKTYSATLREYMVIGEAIGKILELLEEHYPQYPWRMVKDFRNFIIHEYFGVNTRIVWDLTQLELDELIQKIESLHNSNL